MEQFRLCWPEESPEWGRSGLLLLVAVEGPEGETPGRSLPCRVVGRVAPGAPLFPQRQQKAETLPDAERVSGLLAAIGVPVNLLGCGYLRAALLAVMQQPDLLRGLNRLLYPAVARQYGVSAGSVERAIRHAIIQTWARGGGERCRQLMGRHASLIGDRPTNGEFIALLADRLASERGPDAARQNRSGCY